MKNGDKLARRYLISLAKGSVMLSLAHPEPPIPMGRARTALRAPAPGWGSYCSVITLPSLPRPPASRPAPSIRALIQSGESPELRRVAPLRHVALKPEYRLPHGDRAIQGCFCRERRQGALFPHDEGLRNCQISSSVLLVYRQAANASRSVRTTEGSATGFFAFELFYAANIVPLVLRSLDFAVFYFAPLRADDEGAAGNRFRTHEPL